MAVLEDIGVTAPTAGVETLGTVEQRRPCSCRVAVLGLLIAGTAPLWVLAPEGLAAAPYVAPLVLVPLLAAAAVWRFGGRAGLLALLVGLALAVVSAPTTAEMLSHPDSFFDFFPAASLLLGAALAVGGSGRFALRRGQSGGRPTGGWTVGERAVVVTSLAALVVLGGVSAAMTVTGQHTVSALERFGADSMTMVGFDYVPDALTVRAGRSARFVVKNDDLALHTFTVDELGVDVIVKPRSDALVEFTPEEPGVYLLYCRPHTQDGQGMVATLTVE